MLRKHQEEFVSTIEKIIEGRAPRTVLSHVTPGGGKSILSVAVCKLIERGLADRICWVVPRDSLRAQGEQNFLDPFFRKLLGHNCMIRAATNEPDPCRGTQGFVTTYQAIGVDVHGIARQEFDRHRYILILDEFHHCELDGIWAGRIQPLYDAAVFRVLMSGTMSRGDNRPIAFLPYKKTLNHATGSTELLPATDAPSLKYIHYSRSDALAEKAIIPMRFYLTDGSASWDLRAGGSHNVRAISKAKPHEISPAIYTALRTEFARELLEKSIAHWAEWKKKIKTAKLLVVTADINTAREALRQVRKLTGRPAAIATSHESAEAKRNIALFKTGKIEILVSIAMAYEGLSVEEITHIACLTHIRSTPWIEQMIARAVRIDKAYRYEGQVAHVFAPDDPLFREIVERIENEQIAAAVMPKEKPEDDQLTLFMPEGFEGEGGAESDIIPLTSRTTGMREHLYGSPEPMAIEPTMAPVSLPVTPKQREDLLRREIESHVRRYCSTNRVKQQKINAEIKGHFGKSRADMTGPELGFVLDFVQRNYPTAYQVRGVAPRVDRRIQIING